MAGDKIDFDVGEVGGAFAEVEVERDAVPVEQRKTVGGEQRGQRPEQQGGEEEEGAFHGDVFVFAL